MEASELDGYAGTDAQEGSERAFVKGQGPFVGPD